MKIVSCVFPIVLGRPLENAEKIKEIVEKTSGDIFLFPAYCLGGVSGGKASEMPYFKAESERALDLLCSFTENNSKCIVTSIFNGGNIAIYDGDVNKSGSFKKDGKTVSVSQSGKESADIILVPTAMPSYPCIKNDVSEFCSALSLQKKCVVAVANAGYGESTADDVFKGFCGVFKNGTITAFMSEDKPEEIFASADYEKADGIAYVRPKRVADKIPYFTKNDSGVYLADLLLLQKQALYSRAKAVGAKKLFVNLKEDTESLLSLYIIAEAAKDLKMKSEKVNVFTSSEKIASVAKAFGFSILPNNENERLCRAEIAEKAEKEKALFVGTTTLSEIAYGKISLLKEALCHYNIFVTTPKTLVWEALRIAYKKDADTLAFGEKLIAKEEKKSIKYDLCDFWVFYFAKFMLKSEDLKNYAFATFEEYDDEEIISALENFKTAYMKNQAIRSAATEGANLIGFVLPYMPTDANYVM